MTTYYIIPAALFAATDWTASDYANVGPVLIVAGTYAGSYAVNTAILDSDACFEKFRTLLESMTVADIDQSEFNKAETEE